MALSINYQNEMWTVLITRWWIDQSLVKILIEFTISTPKKCMSYSLFMVEVVAILYGAGCGESEALRWGEVWDAPWGRWFRGCEAWGGWGEWGCKGGGGCEGCERCCRLGGLMSTSVKSSLKSSRTRFSRLISVKPKARNWLITANELHIEQLAKAE